uniref:Secreted protein n=1 Tax=Physcomitrium patens TaxID=3218 RepID=A0A2K1JG59_PHYPA|nr:hypothetical protein PHYPA_017937 [Physcomitrium patens]
MQVGLMCCAVLCCSVLCWAMQGTSATATELLSLPLASGAVLRARLQPSIVDACDGRICYRKICGCRSPVAKTGGAVQEHAHLDRSPRLLLRHA